MRVKIRSLRDSQKAYNASQDRKDGTVGRNAIFNAPMTPAERQGRVRANREARRHACLLEVQYAHGRLREWYLPQLRKPPAPVEVLDALTALETAYEMLGGDLSDLQYKVE